MTFYTDGECIFSNVVIPSHLGGWKNFAHGGIISTILDEVMGWTAIFRLRCLTLTKSMSIDFLKPVILETPLRAEGRLLRRDSEREATLVGHIQGADGTVLAKATGTFAVFTPDAALKYGMADDLLMKDIDPLLHAWESWSAIARQSRD